MRRTARLSAAIGLALCLSIVAMLGGCARPEYRFVASSERDLVLRVPTSWNAINTKAALKASGNDPATWNGWAAFYDGSPKPALAHVKQPTTDDPILYARSIPVSDEERALVTDAGLLEMILPATAQERAAATKSKEFAILSKETVAQKHQHGAHVTFMHKIGNTVEVYDHIALTDPKARAIHVAFVHCTQQCFRSHPEIDGVVTSLTLKSP